MPSQKIELLIDGDVIAFTAASACQHVLHDSFGLVYPFAFEAEGEAIVENMLYNLKDQLKATSWQVILSDPSANWRKDIWPAYKANRKDTARPLLLDHLKKYLQQRHEAYFWPELEADDVLGILSTEPHEDAIKRIIVGRDKDFKTIPGFYHQIKNLDVQGRPIVYEITQWEAQRYHLFQTLKGDMTDGYPGCPGIGDSRATELLDNPQLLRRTDGVITRGPRKGEPTDRWVAEPTQDLWAMVVSNYRKAGLEEKDALLTARLANILHHDQYNRETQEITLWTPQRIQQA